MYKGGPPPSAANGGASYAQPPPSYYGAQPASGATSPSATFEANPIHPSHAGASLTGVKLSNPQKYNDIWAAILFILQFLTFIGLAGYFISYYVNNNNSSGGGSGSGSSMALSPEARKYAIYTGLLVIGCSSIFSILYLALVKKFPRTMIHVSFLASIAIYALFFVWCIFQGTNYIVMTILFAVLAILQTVFYFLWRRRIPFTASLLKTVMDVIGMYPMTVVLAFFFMVFQMIYSFLVVLLFMGVDLKYGAINYGLFVFVIFSYYWTTQMLKAIVHTTAAGVFATFYFVVGSGATAENPTSKSFRRAMTYSFGSVAFGSLLVAIVQTLRVMLRARANDRGLLDAILDCILSIIESLIQFFNHYAYTEIAIYGKSYINAAKDTWSLLKHRGMDVVVNDILIDKVLWLAILLVSLASGFLAYAYIAIARNIFTTDQAVFIAIVSGIIGGMVMLIMAEVISSGTATTIVCFAEDPEALRRTKPELYNEFVRTYSLTF